jgi:hypothetical protein
MFLNDHRCRNKRMVPQSFKISFSRLFHSYDRLNVDNDLHLFASQFYRLATPPVFLKDQSGVTQVLEPDRLANFPDSFSCKMSEIDSQYMHIQRAITIFLFTGNTYSGDINLGHSKTKLFRFQFSNG